MDYKPFPNKKYQIIYADPPWSYNDKNCNGNCQQYYSTMSIKDICNLSVKKISDTNCILFLWCTYPMLKEGLQVIESWGFIYKTIAFQWLKFNKKSNSLFFGLGRWTRGNTEACLIGIKGKISRQNNNVFQVIKTRLRAHSKKPDIVRDKIIQLVGDLPRIELFARQKVEGWDSWGNEF